jgi:uncharacterized protein
MELENPPSLPDSGRAQPSPVASPPVSPPPSENLPRRRGIRWVFFGDQGLRVGWSALLFLTLIQIFLPFLGTIFVTLDLIRPRDGFTPRTAFVGELIGVVAMLAAAAVMAAIENRRLLDYNLRGPGRLARFAAGSLAGFVAISALVGMLAWGGWLRFGNAALSGERVPYFAAIWGGAFLVVALREEGIMRCYLLFTLTRGIRLWWAVAAAAAICADEALRIHGRSAPGVYLLALLGLLPCFVLHIRRASGAPFWQAAWITSTYFAYGHTINRGETWIGIFSAGAMGFVFCVSVRVTGSAWWAIGCHGAWDWAQTYFYGTPDSGLVASGHYLNTWPSGSPLWSGGMVGPEGSLLAPGIIALLLIAILVLYRHSDRAPALPAKGRRQAAG